MAEISEDEEKLIDEFIANKEEVITITKGDRTFNINRNNIYCYGNVNFRDDNDLSVIDKFKFLNHLEGVGLKVYANYNYETHSCKSPRKFALQSETWSPVFLSKFAHAALNKPERIILFDI